MNIFLGSAEFNTIIDNPESVIEVVNAVTGDTEQSSLYCTQNVQQWKVSKSLKWSDITPEEMEMGLQLIGASQKGQEKRLLVNSPHNFHTHFPQHCE
jgi:hypothetical protein